MGSIDTLCVGILGGLGLQTSYSWLRNLRGPGARTMVRRAELSKIATQRFVAIGNGRSLAVHRGEHTFIETWNCDGAFTAVRLIYASAVGGAGFAIGAASICAADRPLAPGAQLPKNALKERFVSVTFDSNGENSDYRQQPVFKPEPHNLELPFPPLEGVNGGENVWTPRVLFSDWMNLQSTRRCSGERGTYLRVKTLVKGGQKLTGPFTAPKEGKDPSDPVSVVGLRYQKLFRFGNYVAPDRELSSTVLDENTNGYGAVYAVQFVTEKLGLTVQAVGDSILQGIGFEYGPYTRDYISFGLLACAYLSKPELPVTFLQSSIGSEKSEDYFRSARADLAYAKVGVALIQTWSGNDISQASSPVEAERAADAAWQRVLQYAELLRKQGGVPIFLTPVPQAPKMGSKQAEEARLRNAKRCAALQKRGELVLDLNEHLGDGAATVSYRPKYRWTDNIHPNTVAHFSLAEKLSGMIATLLP